MAAHPVPHDDPLEWLRQELARLRLRAGSPSLRDIERLANHGISHTTVAKVLRCQVLPSWGQVDVLVTALGGDPAAIKEWWIEAEQRRTVPNGVPAPAVPADG